MDAYRLSKAYEANDGIEFSVHVLTHAAWPSYPGDTLYLPEIVRLLDIIMTLIFSWPSVKNPSATIIPHKTEPTGFLHGSLRWELACSVTISLKE